MPVAEGDCLPHKDSESRIIKAASLVVAAQGLINEQANLCKSDLANMRSNDKERDFWQAQNWLEGIVLTLRQLLLEEHGHFCCRET